MIKTKMILDGVLSCDAGLDEKINKFIRDKNVLDIKYASISNRASALIVYEIEENEEEE